MSSVWCVAAAARAAAAVRLLLCATTAAVCGNLLRCSVRSPVLLLLCLPHSYDTVNHAFCSLTSVDNALNNSSVTSSICSFAITCTAATAGVISLKCLDLHHCWLVYWGQQLLCIVSGICRGNCCAVHPTQHTAELDAGWYTVAMQLDGAAVESCCRSIMQ